MAHPKVKSCKKPSERRWRRENRLVGRRKKWADKNRMEKWWVVNAVYKWFSGCTPNTEQERKRTRENTEREERGRRGEEGREERWREGEGERIILMNCLCLISGRCGHALLYSEISGICMASKQYQIKNKTKTVQMCVYVCVCWPTQHLISSFSECVECAAFFYAFKTQMPCSGAMVLFLLQFPFHQIFPSHPSIHNNIQPLSLFILPAFTACRHWTAG